MAFFMRTYSCDNGGEAEPHEFEVMLKSGEHPKFCPVCGAEVDAESLPLPSKIAIGGSAIARATDQTYRLLESSTAARAAELGAPALKVTDLKDNLREGDVAAKLPVSPEFRNFEEERRQLGLPPMTRWGGGFASPGARVGAPIPAGAPGQAYAGPGHIALAAAQPHHEERVREIVANPMYQPYVRGR